MKPTVFMLSLVERKVATPLGGLLARIFERARETHFGLFKKNKTSDLDADLKGRFCAKPFESIEMQENGSIYLCCPVWLPTRAGNLVSGNAREIWNSERAQAIARRRSSTAASPYCNKDDVPGDSGGHLADDRRGQEGPDQPRDHRREERPSSTASRASSTCRTTARATFHLPELPHPEASAMSKGMAYTLTKKLHDKLGGEFLTEPSDQDFTLSVTGSGDPFGSRVYREFLRELRRREVPQHEAQPADQRRAAQRQGMAAPGQASTRTSTPSSSPSMRRGRRPTPSHGAAGSWGELIKNMEMIGELRREGTVKYLRLDYVVQDVNFREMEEFVALGKRFSPDVIYFSRAAFVGHLDGGRVQGEMRLGARPPRAPTSSSR